MRVFQQRNYAGLYGAVLLGVMVSTHLVARGPGEYLYELAETFAAGRLHLETFRPDFSVFNGRYYYPGGPLPPVLLVPLAAAGWHIDIAVFLVLINLGVFYLVYLLARRFQYSPGDACWLTLAFVFGTSFVNSSLLPWDFSHRIVVLFLFFAIIEYVGKRRMAVIGLLVGLAMATRTSAGINIAFFAFAAMTETSSFRDKISSQIKLLVPFGAVACLLGLYNFLRFGNPLESGYAYQLTSHMIPYAEWNSWGNITGPTLSLANVPTNLKFFLLGLPEPHGIGSSVFLLSPFLIYLWWIKWDHTNKLIVLNCAAVLLFVLSFRSSGFRQIGYRFSLDFLPFVFWMLMRSQLPITRTFKALILVATVVDLALVVYFLATGATRRPV
jgi:hypothetical protein